MILKINQRKQNPEGRGFIWNKMNCIIIHGSNKKDLERMKEEGLLPQNKRHWIPWIKQELEKRGIKTFTPLMPRNWAPEYDEWKKEFGKLHVYENTVLVGHSLGGAFLVRWLGETKKKVKKLILLVPAYDSRVYPYLKDFLDFEIDETIKERVEEIVIFSSDEDRHTLDSVKFYNEKLKGRLIEIKGMKHFIEKYMKTKEFPELLGGVLSAEKIR